MESFEQPAPIKKGFFTPGVIILCIIALNGAVFAAMRFIFGLGYVTNLNNEFPWGIWIGIDVAVGVALAAGGFTTAALGHIFHKEDYHAITRPALLTAMLGYTFVAMSVTFDLGRYWNIWRPIFYWNGNSALFEVGICVMSYVTVLYVEFVPIVIERFKNKVNLPGILAKLNKLLEAIIKLADNTVNPAMFIFLIAGVVLSCLHQSSLGTVMIVAGSKIHPLWQTPVAPLLFLLSAISVGFPMVIMEGIISARSFGLKAEMHILSKLGRMVGPLLGVYLAFKIGDMFIRKSFVYLTEVNIYSIMFAIELLFGVIIPLRMFMWDKVLRSQSMLFLASCLVIFGVFLNRVNNYIVAYNPPYVLEKYFPSFAEISITLGFIAAEVLAFRLFVMIFPIISQPVKGYVAKTKYAIRGAI
jgi:Ni/Fe-hydrogenase subunit HybB-like protein